MALALPLGQSTFSFAIQKMLGGKDKRPKHKTKTKSKHETTKTIEPTTTKSIEPTTTTAAIVTKTSSVQVTSFTTSTPVSSSINTVVVTTGSSASSLEAKEVSVSPQSVKKSSSKVKAQNKGSSTVTEVNKKETTKISKSKPTKAAKVVTKSIATPSIASILAKSNNTRGNMNETIGGFEAKANHLVAVGTPTFALSLSAILALVSF